MAQANMHLLTDLPWLRSVIAHVALLIAVVTLPAIFKTEPQTPQTIKATLVSSADLKPTPAPAKPLPTPVPIPEPIPTPTPPEPVVQPEPPTPKPQPTPPAAPKTPPKPLEKAVEKTPLPISEKGTKAPAPAAKPNTNALENELKAIEEQARKAQEQRLARERQAHIEALKRKAQEEEEALMSSADSKIVNEFANHIKSRVQSRWIRPESAKNGMQVVLRVTMTPSGDVLNVVTVKSSGDVVFDTNAAAAVVKASPLPVPNDLAIFNTSFRNFNLVFRPEDL